MISQFRIQVANASQSARLLPAVAHHSTVSTRNRHHIHRVALVEPKTQEIERPLDLNQYVREGHYEANLVQQQANKQDNEQPLIASVLEAWPTTAVADVAIVGCGPAGLYLAAQLAQKGLKVALLGHDVPFVNNYGVWMDEIRELGMEHTLECSWPDALCYFGERETRVGRGYGRVDRRVFRKHLLQLCKDSGVGFLSAEVTAIDAPAAGKTCTLTCSDGTVITTRLVTLAAGAAAGKFLKYEEDAPTVAAQTAYGIEAEVEGYPEAYNPELMLFMDFRRHHSGIWENTAQRLKENNYPNGGDGLWGNDGEAPSFLYAMPLGGKRVFLEETCLVAKPALPFAVLKRRLERRLGAVGITVTKVHEEEWSYIPVGGPMPLQDQTITAFGAAANLVHPATGFSVTRSLREAPKLAAQIAEVLGKELPVGETSALVWQALWPVEKCRQASFHVFGMELLAALDLGATNDFFNTFFSLPSSYWRGFLASNLSSGQLVAFALLTFAIAPVGIKAKLVSHLLTDPAGQYLYKHYLGSSEEEGSPQQASAAAALLMFLGSSALQQQ